ncbi:glycosyltransferase family 4 protein [Cetobacterium sp.]
MKILIVSAGVLPIPVAKGGAVETLIEYLIDENEKYGLLELEVVSCLNDEAVNMSKKYKKTNFYFIKRRKFLTKTLSIINLITKKMGLNKFNDLENYDYLIGLKKIVKNNNYDKIIVENRSLYINYLKRKTKDNLYLHLHNDYLNNSNPLAKEIYDNSTGILTVSDYIKNCVKSINKNDTKTKTLINCTNVSLFNREKNNIYRKRLRRKLKINEEDIVYLFSGRLTREKGIKELLLAFEQLEEKNIKLLIIGSGWYGHNKKNKYQQELEELAVELKEKIIFTGFIARDEVAKYHSVADIAVVPSMWEEPAALVVLEAQASGLPLIITNSGGIPELVNEESAIIVNKENDVINNLYKAMLFLLKNGEKRVFMGIEGRKNAEKYDRKYYYYNFIRLLKES